MHREGINGIIHLPNLQGGMEGEVGSYKWKGGGVEHSTLFLFGTEKIFCEFLCDVFFVQKISHQYKVRKTYLILDWFTNLKFCKTPAIV